jgi:AraC-like DNA-binding protein
MQDSPLPTATLELRIGSRPSTTSMARLALEDTPEHERPARLREFFEPLGVRYDARHVGDDPIEIDLTIRALPGIQLLSGRMQGTSYRRTCHKADPTDDLGLVINPGGPLYIAQRGREILLDDGDATLVSLTDSVEASHRPPGYTQALRIPVPALAPHLPKGRDSFLRRIPRDDTALRLLTNYVDVAWQDHMTARYDLQRVMVSHVYDLAAVAIGATREAQEVAQNRGVRAARLLAVKQDIARYLDRPDLTAAALAVRHRCTPRLIQRLFETTGTTFTEYVLVQRLARARDMLADPHFDGEKISSIAYDCGFNDVSYFNRVFRRSFGTSPSDVRAQARQAARERLT